ncbi:MAG: oligosaccharide flippase family protein [Emcibacter sp.]|nr:oligosaccharide flippase family protein [Emcibacter sp.]
MTPSEDKDKKDIVKGAGVNFLGFIIRLSSRLPFILLVMALFGKELYGRYIFIITTVELGAALAVFGFRRSLFKFVQDQKYRDGHSVEEVIVAALICSFTVGVLMIALITMSAEQLAIWFDYPEMISGLKMLAPIILVISMMEILLAGTRISRKMKYEMMARSFVEPYILLFAMLVFYFFDFGEKGLLLAYVVAIFAALLMALWGCLKLFSFKNFIRARPSLSMISRISRFSAPTAFHDLALLVFMRMDVFTVKFFFAEGILGIYNVAQQITTSVEKIYQSFYPILAPVMAKNLVEKDYAVVERQMIMVSRWTLMVQGLLVLFAIFYGEAFMGLIINGDVDKDLMVASGIILVFLMLGETVNGGFGMTDMPILYRFPIFNPIISIVMVPLYVVIAAVFVRIFDLGVEGVAMALCCIYILMNLVRVITVRCLMGINMLRLSLLKVVLAAVGCSLLFKAITMVSPVELLQNGGAAMGVPLLMLLYIISIFSFCMTRNDKAKFFARFGREEI